MLVLRIVRSPPQTPIRFRIRLRQAIINPFTSAAHLQAKPLPPRRVLDEHDLEERFIRGCGPGGQKINKISCAVHLRHIPTGIMVKTQETRSQAQNRKVARRLLADKVEQMEKGRESRVEMKAQIKKRKKASANKKARRKYRRLEEKKEKEKNDEEGDLGEKLGEGMGMDGDAELDEDEVEDDAEHEAVAATITSTTYTSTSTSTTKKKSNSKR